MRRLHFSFYQKYATRISVCVISVSKSQDFLLKVRRLSEFFSTTTPTASRRRVVILSTTTQGIRLRRRVDVFFDDVGHYGRSRVTTDEVRVL